MRKLLCGICRHDPVKAKGRCGSCLEYLRTHDHDAPVDVVERRLARRRRIA